ncbi:serine/threonine-protein phosphatase 6 regulatory ankyrin repeat subunit A-like isoform X2 [Penaeus indicus]|uniref:serine/threonine-protein phosphatase 6 regulatory ankyrin repeat subunit A-like isoform X2 n=1 Tax=Penaeus indicus TaxID=29960 RepID=UPI00300D3DE8
MATPAKETKKTEMHRAAEAGDEVRLRRLVDERQEDINKQDENGLTPLHLAAKKTRPQCCQILLDVSHKEINVKDRSGNTPLALCISNKPESFATARLLVSEGANVNFSNKAKLAALHTAAERGNLEVVRLLLQQKDIALNPEDSERHTPLHLASKAGHWKICQALVLAGANVAACNVRGQTALHIAAKMGFSECCKHLLSAGEVNSPDAQGNTALHLLCASGKNSPECARVLFEGGASADSKNKKGETPFHVAQFTRFDVKKTFQHQEVDLFLRDASGSTALHYAADRRESKHVEFILLMARERSLDVMRLVNARNEAGMTALHVAIAREERESCRALLKAGADATISCESFGTPISMAYQRGLQDICDILTEK